MKKENGMKKDRKEMKK